MIDAPLPYRLLVDTTYHRAGEIVQLLPDQVLDGTHAPAVDVPYDAEATDANLTAKLDAVTADVAALKVTVDALFAAPKSDQSEEIAKIWARIVALETQKPAG